MARGGCTAPSCTNLDVNELTDLLVSMSGDRGSRVLADWYASEIGITFPLRTMSWRVGLLLSDIIWGTLLRFRALREWNAKVTAKTIRKKPRIEMMTITGTSHMTDQRPETCPVKVGDEEQCPDLLPSEASVRLESHFKSCGRMMILTLLQRSISIF